MDILGLTELGFRWTHFTAGVAWIGLLYFFNWVNAAFVATLDAETKRKVLPELMPRALWWFRMGALWTWLTGFFLLFMVYYHGQGGYLLDGQVQVTAMTWLPAFGGLFVGFAVYDLLFKALGKQHAVAVVLWGLVTLGFAAFLREVQGFSMRATYIHVGALFGTCMAANVWMRIWPAQRRILAAVKEGRAPEASDPATASLRSKHNTYMSVPLLLLMVSVHQDMILSIQQYWVVLPVVLLIGQGVTTLLYGKAKALKGL
jgi:uncharacterized membrane protein